MRWKIIAHNKPPNGTECVVGRPSKDHKPTYGLYTFYDYGTESYWLPKYGSKVKVYKYDNWCDVDDIIEYAESKFLEDFKESLDEAKLYL